MPLSQCFIRRNFLALLKYIACDGIFPRGNIISTRILKDKCLHDSIIDNGINTTMELTEGCIV